MKLVLLYILLWFNFLSCQSQQPNQDLPVFKVLEIKEFLKDKNYNQDIAIFVNFKIHSGKYRYFVYDLKKDKILQKAIVAHGSGSVTKNSTNLQFSNIEGSYQSSLGKYEIKESYHGKFGKSYRLNGLDKSNSNAMSRAIVMHSYPCILDVETNNSACLSLGCPMLSPKAFTKTSSFIDGSNKTIVLYAFY